MMRLVTRLLALPLLLLFTFWMWPVMQALQEAQEPGFIEDKEVLHA